MRVRCRIGVHEWGPELQTIQANILAGVYRTWRWQACLWCPKKRVKR